MHTGGGPPDGPLSKAAYLAKRRRLEDRYLAGELTLAELDHALDALSDEFRAQAGLYPDRWPPGFRPPGPGFFRLD